MSREPIGPVRALSSGVLLICAGLLAVVVAGAPPPSRDLLARISDTAARRHAVTYSSSREYRLVNQRFGKTATVKIRMTSRAGEGKQFTVIERSGSTRLIGLIEKIIESEAESSRPAVSEQHEIGPGNYDARVTGTETIGGRECWVVNLAPKNKTKYTVTGRAWVDQASFGIVRLDATTAASLSVWVGSPHIVEDFTQIGGIWLPDHLKSVSSTLLLGTSELEIRYTDYHVEQR